MIKGLKVRIDYLSVRLTPAFTGNDLMAYAMLPLVDTETGEKVGINLQHDQFKPIVVPGGREVASFYRGGELIGWELAKKYNLAVTRLDIAVDFPSTSKETSVQQIYALEDRLNAYFDSKEYEVKRQTWRGSREVENGAEGTVYFTRTSEKQLRVYHKLPHTSRTDEGHSVRVEWQTRDKVAKALFAHLNQSKEKWELAILEAWQSLNMKHLGGDFFEIDENIELGVVELPKKEKHNTAGYEAWILSFIAPSLYKFRRDTGKNLCIDIQKEMDRLEMVNGEYDGRPHSTPMERKLKNYQLRKDREQEKLRLQRELSSEPNIFGGGSGDEGWKISKETIRSFSQPEGEE
jgi:hypothetical protein